MKSPGIQAFISRYVALLGLALLGACGGDTSVNTPVQPPFTATLNGANETPPNNSQGEGIGVFIFHPDDRTFNASVVTTGVNATVAHIHEGAPGVPGPIIFPLTKAQGSVEWKANGTLTEAQEATLRAGNYYFNVHSPTFPDGEIRGQIEEKSLSPEQQQRLQQLLQQAGSALQSTAQQTQQLQGQLPSPATPATTATPQ